MICTQRRTQQIQISRHLSLPLPTIKVWMQGGRKQVGNQVILKCQWMITKWDVHLERIVTQGMAAKT